MTRIAMKNPRTLMMVGLTCLVIAILPRFIHLTPRINPDMIDFASGLMTGVSIGLNLLAIWLGGHNDRCAG